MPVHLNSYKLSTIICEWIWEKGLVCANCQFQVADFNLVVLGGSAVDEHFLALCVALQ